MARLKASSKLKKILFLATISLIFLGSLSFAYPSQSKLLLSQTCQSQDAENITVSEILDEPVTLNGTEVEVVDCDKVEVYEYSQTDLDSPPYYGLRSLSGFPLLIFLIPLSLVAYGYRKEKFGESVKVFGTSLLIPGAGFTALKILQESKLFSLALIPFILLPLLYIAHLYRNGKKNYLLYLAIYLSTLLSIGGVAISIALFTTPTVV